MFSPAFSVSSSSLPAFLSFFQPTSFRVFNNLWIVPRGCFTSIGLVHLSLLLSSPFLSFFLFSLFFPLFFLSFSPFSSFSLSPPAEFWCGDRRHAAPLPTACSPQWPWMCPPGRQPQCTFNCPLSWCTSVASGRHSLAYSRATAVVHCSTTLQPTCYH